ncbi:MAG TPA: hypothetical protein VKA27_03295 [Sunxiuqinia sp.]|nr:hypothetical protein [Sunxiuqinia sp.]
MGVQEGDVCMPEIVRRRVDSFIWTRFFYPFHRLEKDGSVWPEDKKLDGNMDTNHGA